MKNHSAFRHFLIIYAAITSLQLSPAAAQQIQQAFSRPRPIVQFQAQGSVDPSPLPSSPQTIVPTTYHVGPVSGADLDCMTRALVFEAVVVDFDSLLAVGTVIANRASARSQRWPSTWCGVVSQYKQFSSHPLQRAPDPQAYSYAMTVANALKSGLVHPGLYGVTEFRTAGSTPPSGMTIVGTFGGNSFYR